VSTEEILAALGVALTMLSTGDLLGLFVRPGRLEDRSLLASGATFRATVTAR